MINYFKVKNIKDLYPNSITEFFIFEDSYGAFSCGDYTINHETFDEVEIKEFFTIDNIKFGIIEIPRSSFEFVISGKMVAGYRAPYEYVDLSFLTPTNLRKLLEIKRTTAEKVIEHLENRVEVIEIN